MRIGLRAHEWKPQMRWGGGVGAHVPGDQRCRRGHRRLWLQLDVTPRCVLCGVWLWGVFKWEGVGAAANLSRCGTHDLRLVTQLAAAGRSVFSLPRQRSGGRAHASRQDWPRLRSGVGAGGGGVASRVGCCGSGRGLWLPAVPPRASAVGRWGCHCRGGAFVLLSPVGGGDWR